MKRIIQVAFVTLGVIGITSLAVPASPTLAVASINTSCNEHILTLPAWYNNVARGNDCVIELASDGDASIQNTIVKIALNVIDILMQMVAYASVIYLIIGGFRYLTSAGSPDRMAGAKKTILNAIFGLIIGMLAVAIVNLVGASL